MASSWVQFVKAHWKKVGGSYKDAMKSAAKLWKKKGKTAEPEKKKSRRRKKR
jgi:hypothetical protein